MAKIMKTNRIRITLDHTVYCSSKAVEHVRHLIHRLENNVFVPLKDRRDEVEKELATFAKNNPQHFNNNGLRVLQERSGIECFEETFPREMGWL